MRPLAILAGLIVLFAQAAFADVIVLHSGDHLEGEIVRETEEAVELRQSFGSGGIKYLQTIRRSRIARIEKGKAPAASQPEPTSTSRPAPEPGPVTTSAALPPRYIGDKAALLRTALWKWAKKDYAGAGVDFSYLITRSTPPELAAFDQEARQKTTFGLADLAAESHFESTMQRAAGRPVRFIYITEHEKPALIPRIAAAYDQAVQQDIPAASTTRSPGAPEGRLPQALEPAPATQPGQAAGVPATSRPANSIQAWLARPAEYGGAQPEAAALLRHIHFAASLLSERIRLDPQLQTDTVLRDQLAADKVRLGELQRVVALRSLAGPRQASPLERRARIEDFRRDHFGVGTRPPPVTTQPAKARFQPGAG